MLLKEKMTVSSIHLCLIVISLLSMYPFFFLIVSSYKSDADIVQNWWQVVPERFAWSNYAHAWEVISKYMSNTVIITGISVVGVVLLSAIAGYAFARLYMFGKEAIFASLFVLILIPDILTLVPQFILVKQLGLLNTWGALIFPYIAGGQIMGIFIMRNYIENLPKEIFEAVKIDGGTELQIFRHIIVPLTKPMALTIAIINAVSIWNDYVWPMTTISKDAMRTIAIGLQSFSSQYEVQMGYLMAANVISTLPILILFIFGTKYFVEGIMSGAVKG